MKNILQQGLSGGFMAYASRTRSILLASALTAAFPGLAHAADGSATAPASGETGEIVVTAQKRTERLIDVPVAVSAVDSATLVRQNIVTLRDFSTRIPGITVAGTGTQNIAIRGVSTGGGTNPTVAVLIDDVPFGSSTYLGKPPIPDFDPAVLERVEVLRGPQGTLYGASSIGGLVKFVTREPSTTRLSVRGEAGVNTVADGGQGWSVRGSANVPIISDRVGLSVSGFYRKDPQWLDTIVPGGARVKDANENKVWGGRAALLLKPFDNFTLTLSALYQKSRNTLQSPANVPVCSTCAATPGTITFDPRGLSTDSQTAVSSLVPTLGKLELYSARGVLDVGFGQLISITAWGRSRLDNTSDLTARFGPILEAFASPPYAAGGTYLFAQPIRTNKFSQELRLTGTSHIADWMVGLFYTNEDSVIRQAITRPDLPAPIYDGNNLSSYQEKAVFADLTFHLTDRFDLQFGGRYANNQQDYNVVSSIDVPAQVLFGPNENSLYRSKENAFTWLVAPTYHFSRDLMAYARVATGYRPGGPNTVASNPTFRHDTTTNYELGLKGSVLDRKLSFDVAVYQVDWKDIQLQNTALPSQFAFFTNGKKARSRGIEGQLTARPWTGMTIDANATIGKSELTDTLSRSTASQQVLVGVAGDRLPYSARFTGNLGVEQEFPLSTDLTGRVGFNINHVGNRFGDFNLDNPSAVYKRAKLPAYTLVDLTGGVTVAKRLEINLYVRNLFDKRTPLIVDTGNGVRLPQAIFSTPRVAGINIAFQY